ncbi:hypothetical protein E4U43_002759 [Claviceps pusilla]|uniref:Uncharacterized protein n=1 Tax=Claviceps pusilla TaxID=123648 RepID=A0A9P7N893_9HYPO|nr:hypothetical protein E4U43_002759 [Claviceps pusilla]
MKLPPARPRASSEAQSPDQSGLASDDEICAWSPSGWVVAGASPRAQLLDNWPWLAPACLKSHLRRGPEASWFPIPSTVIESIGLLLDDDSGTATSGTISSTPDQARVTESEPNTQ